MKFSNKNLIELYNYLTKRRDEILNDNRYPRNSSEIAAIEINAPLALIQLGMKTEIKLINECLDKLND